MLKLHDFCNRAIQRIARERLTGCERTTLDAFEREQQAEHAEQLAALAHSQAAAELGGLVYVVQDEHLDDLLAIEREQSHAAALIADAEHERLAFLDVLEKWAAYLGDCPEVAQVHALADRLRAGDTGANDVAKDLALSLRRAEGARHEALEQQRIEAARRAELEQLRQQRLAAMQAEEEQQQTERELLVSLARQPDTPETLAPERRVGGDEWVEYEENGERYRHRASRPDERYWLNPSGEWHLQPTGQSDYNDGYDYP